MIEIGTDTLTEIIKTEILERMPDIDEDVLDEIAESITDRALFESIGEEKVYEGMDD